MNAETFLEKFDLLAETPNAVARLRHLILQTAAQGRLVEQSTADGSCDELLASLTRAYSADFDVEAYKPSEPPIPTLPKNWLWAPTSLLCDLQTGKRMKGGAQDSGVISLGGEHLKPDGTVDYTVPRYVSRDFYDDMPNGKVALHDTLMVKDGATTGKTAFVATLPADGLAAVNEHVFLLRWRAPIDRKLAFYFIRAFAPQHIASKSAGLIGGIRREAVLEFPFPLPPLAEQKRIVTKVDELMALCDRLEAQQQQHEHAHAALAHAVLARFADEPTAENLEYLTHPSYAIAPAALRMAILAAAVRGRLLPQQTCEQLAITELNRCRKELGRDEWSPPEDTIEDTLFEVPASWCWVTVDAVADSRLGKMLDVEKNRGEPHPYLRNTNVHWFRFELESIKTMLFDPSEVEEFIVRAGDVLICEGGHGIARAAVWEDQLPGMTFQKALHRVRPLPCLDPYFFTYCIRVFEAEGHLQRYYTGAGIPHFTGRSLAKVLFPLPPHAEQRRIVAKINDLMALVDRLEADLAAVHATGEMLMDAVVAELCSK
jgi:type I restriction enzyme S subunit